MHHRRRADTSAKTYELKKLFRNDDYFSRRKKDWTSSILNVNEGSFMGRTPKAWFRCTLFYMLFYATLAVLCAFCFSVFLATVKDDIPSALTKQPGLSYQPCLSMNDSVYLIAYDAAIADDLDAYVNAIEESLSKYGKNWHNKFGDCSKDTDFGFKDRRPCIFLKINRIIGFQPDTYDYASDMPNEIPEDLQTFIYSQPADAIKNRVWLSCKTNLNKELKVKYYPEIRSVSGDSLNVPKKITYGGDGDGTSFYNDNDYERIVAVQLENPPTNRRFVVKCYMWAKNIKIDENKGKGMVRFDLLLKEVKKAK